MLAVVLQDVVTSVRSNGVVVECMFACRSRVLSMWPATSSNFGPMEVGSSIPSPRRLLPDGSCASLISTSSSRLHPSSAPRPAEECRMCNAA